MKIAAVITTGGTVDGPFAQAIGTNRKALAVMRGKTILERTILALRGAGVRQVAVIGGAGARAVCEASVDRFIEESDDGSENQLLALRAWGEGTRLLYATSDMPYITSQAVAEVLQRTAEDGLVLPLCEYADFERRFPESPPFGLTLGGERVVNAGMFVIPAGAAGAIERLAAGLFRARKSPLAMARIAGLPLLFRFALKTLRITDIERRGTAILGFPARALRNAAPELAYDIDTFEEYIYAAAHD